MYIYKEDNNDEHKDSCLYFNRDKLLKDINSNEHDIKLYLKNKNEKKFICDISYVDNGMCVFPHLSLDNKLLSLKLYNDIDDIDDINTNTNITSIKLKTNHQCREYEQYVKKILQIKTLEYLFIDIINIKYINKILENMSNTIKYLNINNPFIDLKRNNLNNLSNNLSILLINGICKISFKILYLTNNLLYLSIKTRSNYYLINNKSNNFIIPNKLNGIIIKTNFIRVIKFPFNIKYITLGSSSITKTTNIKKYKKLVLFLICEKN